MVAGAAAGAAAGEVAGEAAGEAVGAAAIQITGNGGRVAKDRQDHRPRSVVLALHIPLGRGMGEVAAGTLSPCGKRGVVKNPPLLRPCPLPHR